MDLIRKTLLECDEEINTNQLKSTATVLLAVKLSRLIFCQVKHLTIIPSISLKIYDCVVLSVAVCHDLDCRFLSTLPECVPNFFFLYALYMAIGVLL